MVHAVVSRAAPSSGTGCVVVKGNPLLSSGGLRQVACRWQRRTVGLKAEVRKRDSGPLGVRCEVITVDESNFEQVVLRSEVPVLVDFWATWCGPCMLVATSMEAIEKKYAGKLRVVKIETDPNPTLVQMYNVYGLPTLVMFRDGEEVEGGRCEGAISLQKLEAMLTEALPSLAAA